MDEEFEWAEDIEELRVVLCSGSVWPVGVIIVWLWLMVTQQFLYES